MFHGNPLFAFVHTCFVHRQEMDKSLPWRLDQPFRLRRWKLSQKWIVSLFFFFERYGLEWLAIDMELKDVRP